MGTKASVDKVTIFGVDQTGTLVLYAAIEEPGWVVASGNAFQVDGEIISLVEGIDVDRMYIYSSSRKSLGDTNLCLVLVGLGSEVKCIGVRIDDTGTNNADYRIDVLAIPIGKIK
jgi:hypothetical protein